MESKRDYQDDRWKLEIERRRLREGLLPEEPRLGSDLWRFEIVCAQPARLVLDRVVELVKIVNAASLDGPWPAWAEWGRRLPTWFLLAHWPISGEAYERSENDFKTMQYDEYTRKYADCAPLLGPWLSALETATDENGRLTSARNWFWRDANVTGELTIEAFAEAADIYILEDFAWMFFAAGAHKVAGGEKNGATSWIDFPKP